MMRLVDLAVDRQPERFGFGRRAQPGRLGLNVHREVQLKLEAMTGRRRVEAALAMDVADRPPVGAWGHTYREEWSPEDLAAVTVERARRLGRGVLQCHPRARSVPGGVRAAYPPPRHPPRRDDRIRAA